MIYRLFKMLIFLSLIITALIIPQDLSAKTTVSSRTGKTSFLLIEEPKSFALEVEEPKGETPEMKSRRFFTQYGNLFGIQNQQQELKLIEVSRSHDVFYFGKYKLGSFPTEQPPFRPKTIRTHVKFQQVYHNIPVFAQEVFVHLEEGNIHSVSSEFTPHIAIDSTIPQLTEDQAKEKAKQIWENEGKQAKYTAKPILYIFNPSILSPKENHNYLVWYVEIANSSALPIEREFLFINARDGNLVFRLPGIFEAKNIQVRDMGYDPHNLGLNDAHNVENFAGETYDYYFNNHGRDSFNGAGATIYAHVRINGSCPNAYWDTSSINFCAGMAARDVVAHELTHAVTQYSAHLRYAYQSGALNESISDIFGAAVDNDDWTMGEDSALRTIRNMRDPSDPNLSSSRRQPDRLFSDLYYCDSRDNGGVHKNSGIPNKLAYLIAEGGSFNGCTISGIGREKEERIIYLTLTKYLKSSSNFADFYQSIKSACSELFGEASSECQNVDNAAKAVEIDQEDAGSQEGARCRGKSRAAPTCGAGSPPPTETPTATTAPPGEPSPTPIPTTPPGKPTITPLPASPSPTPIPPPTNPPAPHLKIWTSVMQNGREIVLPQNSRLPKGTPISICYDRPAGAASLTIDRGAGLIAVYSGFLTEPKNNACLYAGRRRFFPLGELASPQGRVHVYTLNVNGQTAATTLLVTTGETEIPTTTPIPPTPTPALTTPPGQPTHPPAPTEQPTNPPTAPPSATSGPTPTGATSSLPNLINGVSRDNLIDYLNHLVRRDDQVNQENQTRYSALPGHITESDYAKTQFESFGLTTQFQPFTVNGVSTRNLIATLPGKNPHQVYLITAHLDSTAANSGTKDPAPGADDNGSGTVAVMEAARVLKNSGLSFNSTIEFVLFSGEEQGLYGSRYYVNQRDTGRTIKGVFNLDMIANRGPSGDCVKFGYRAYTGSNVLSDKAVAMNNQYNIGLKATSIASSITASDHAPFWQAGIPAIFGYECDFSPVYHTVSDKTDKINFEQLTKTVKAVTAAVASLSLE